MVLNDGCKVLKDKLIKTFKSNAIVCLFNENDVVFKRIKALCVNQKRKHVINVKIVFGSVPLKKIETKV